MRIDVEFKSVIPALSEEEFANLTNSLLAEGCRDALVVWGDILIDGHNRYAICEQHGISYRTVQMEFDSRESALVWMIDNQKGRRNLTDGWKYELAQVKKRLLAEKGRESQGRRSDLLSNTDKRLSAHNTQKEIASELGWSTGKTAQADYIWTNGGDEIKQRVKAGDASVNQAYIEVKRAEKKDVQAKKHDELKDKEYGQPTGKYDVIVIDPPWPMKKIDREVTPNQTGFDYPTMTEQEIAEMEMPSEDDCHMFMWTTHKFLPMSLRILERWGFKYTLTMVWHKNGGFQPFGLPQYNCEFCVYARRGNPVFVDTKAFPTCFNADRTEHSAKPDIFYDIIRRVTAGRRIDIFNRRQIDGFDVWGNESGD